MAVACAADRGESAKADGACAPERPAAAENAPLPLARWCNVDTDCELGQQCVLGVCEGEAVSLRAQISAEAEPSHWRAEPCWMAGSREVLNPVPLFPGCDPLYVTIYMCEHSSGLNCLGAGRLLEAGADGSRTVAKRALRYYERACELGIDEGCERVGRLHD